MQIKEKLVRGLSLRPIPLPLSCSFFHESLRITGQKLIRSDTALQHGKKNPLTKGEGRMWNHF